MAAKDVKFHDHARTKIVKGVNILADAVKDNPPLATIAKLISEAAAMYCSSAALAHR